MSLPIVIIFERHWDTIPKYVIKNLLPDLNKKGYQTLCFEAPQNLSSTDIVNRHNFGLKDDSDIHNQAEKLLKQVGITKNLSEVSFSELAKLLNLYVPSQKYVDVAEKIKQLPASYLLKEVFNEAANLSMSLKGIDIDSETFDKMISLSIQERVPALRLNEEHRITTLFENLLKLRTEQEEGVIFVCGAIHAKGLIDNFKKQGLEDEVLYYFPHSSSRYDESVDEITMMTMNGTLQNHTHLLSQQDIKPFGERIIKEITGKTRYTKEILDKNSHSQFLSECFKTNVRVFLRPGYHVDALVDVSKPSDIKEIQRRVIEVGIQTHNISLEDRNYLVIPNVNDKETFSRLYKIPS